MFRLFSFPILIFALLASGTLAPVTDSGIVGIGSFWRYPIMIFGFLMLITVHEFGHWLFARLFGFATPVFSIGFGKRSWSWVLGTFWETEFRISPIPLGGYVLIPALQDESTVVAPAIATDGDGAALLDQSNLSCNCLMWRYQLKRIIVAAGGVAFNFLSAMLMLFAIQFFIGNPVYKAENVRIDGLSQENTIASTAGFKPSDRFLQVGEKAVNSPEDLVAAFKANAGKEVSVSVMRDGQPVNLAVSPNQDGFIGIKMAFDRHKYFEEVGFGGAAVYAVSQTWDMTMLTFKGLGMIMGIVPKPAGITDSDLEVRGVVGIVQMGAEAFNSGAYELIWFLAAISIGIAAMNILPLPVLDGGHIVIFLLEGYRGKAMDVAFKRRLFQVFMALLLMIFALSLYNDLKHILA